MSQSASQAIAVTKALEAVLRQDRGRLIAALTYRLHSLSLAQDALQEACLSAMSHWAREGLPHSPQGWLIQVAFRKALDLLRSEGRSKKREQAMQVVSDLLGQDDAEEIPDERLRLIFTCCHPALELKSRVALTLRTVCGISTVEIAKLFLDNETAMGQRLSRAKSKITQAGIAYAIPAKELWDERLQAVLTTIYLIFTTGYNASLNEARDLCGEALFLAELLNSLCPEQPEVEGLLALLLLTHSRRKAKTCSRGATVPPSQQKRHLWDKDQKNQGLLLLETALHRKRAGPFQIKAALSACQMTAPAPDWPQILALYTALLTMEPTPVVQMNHAVALAENGHLPAALVALESVRDQLENYQPFHAALAAVLEKSGKTSAAIIAYTQAIALASNVGDRLMLTERMEKLSGTPKQSDTTKTI